MAKSKNPEVEEAKATRDALLADVDAAIAKVDDLQDELLKQYEEAGQ